MKRLCHTISSLAIGALSCLIFFQSASAQTDADAIMIPKNYICSGVMYSYSSWKNYWEGTYKRNNFNLGTVSTQMYGIMGNYGISDKLNVLFGVPYVTTKASAGTLKGMKGIQDLSLTVKYMALKKAVGKRNRFGIWTRWNFFPGKQLRSGLYTFINRLAQQECLGSGNGRLPVSQFFHNAIGYLYTKK